MACVGKDWEECWKGAGKPLEEGGKWAGESRGKEKSGKAGTKGAPRMRDENKEEAGKEQYVFRDELGSASEGGGKGAAAALEKAAWEGATKL